MRRTALVLLLCLISAVEAQTAPQPAAAVEKSAGTLHAKAQLVEIDVLVTDRQGNPVPHLQRSDFSIFEDKAPQTIKGFEEHDSASHATPPPALPAGTFSNAVPLPEDASVDILLLDSLNTPPESQPYLRDQLVSYINHAKPGTRLAIYVLNTRLRMLQGPTSDPALLKMALLSQGVKFSPLLQRDLNHSDVHEVSKTMTDLITSHPQSSGLLIQVQSMLLDTDARASSQKTQVRVQLSLAALDELARALAAVPGRKNLVWFSGAFPTTILRDAQTTGDKFAGNENMEDEVRKTLALLDRSRVAVSPVDARGLEAPPSALSSEPAGNPQTDRLTYGTTATNPRDAQFFHDTGAEHETMQVIADTTGGMAIFNTNGLSNAMEKATAAAHSYYTLSYTPPPNEHPGQPRQVAVKVKESGLQLAYRHEYFPDSSLEPSRTPAASLSAAPPPAASSVAVQSAMAPHTQNATEILFEVSPSSVGSSASSPAETCAAAVKWVGMTAFEASPHEQYIVTLNVDAKTVSFTESSDGKMHAVIDFILILYDPSGKQVDSKLDRAVLALEPAHYQKFLADGMRFHFNLVLPDKGSQILRFGVHDARTDRIGTLELTADAIRAAENTALR